MRLAETLKYRHKSEISDEEILLFELSEYAVAMREMISEFVFLNSWEMRDGIMRISESRETYEREVGLDDGTDKIRCAQGSLRSYAGVMALSPISGFRLQRLSFWIRDFTKFNTKKFEQVTGSLFWKSKTLGAFDHNAFE